jgi:light-regulated signal transduction histidine kinase (bacteriophytochrome)
VTCVIDEGLQAAGDPDLLRRVVRTLAENAWKFTSSRAAARIEVGRNRRDAERPFFVRDNGAGFDMQYAGRLFQPLQRLHSDKEFPGFGIGLAIAHRIVRRHGGRIWAEAAPGEGATFFFTLGA